MQAIDNNCLEQTDKYLSAAEERVCVWESETQVYYEVECRKKIFFFNICNQTRIEVVGRQNYSGLLLSSALHDCRFCDNTMFGLISHFSSQVNMSTSENKLPKKKTKVIATRVTQHFADLLEQYCRQDAYINCSDLIRDALREKLRKDVPKRFERLFESVRTEQEEEKIAPE